VHGWQFRKGLPTVLEINGEPVMRKSWARRRFAANDDVRFVSYPLGGNGQGGAKQITGLVALIAVSAFAFGFWTRYSDPLTVSAADVEALVDALIDPGAAGPSTEPLATANDRLF
jgi:hypothetical protein